MPELATDGLWIGLVLLAALLHASWNALAKASGDPLVNLAVVTSTGGLLAVPWLICLPMPGARTWLWLGFSATIHFAYQLSLARMYRLGELSQVYPIARGLAPLGVAMLGATLAEERLAWHQLVGLLLASFAVVVLGRAGRPGESNREAVAMALLTALLIGTYTYSDAQGVRSVRRPEDFIAWSFFLGCVPYAMVVMVIRRGSRLTALRRVGWRAVGGGVMATVGYGIALWAMARAPMAQIASLRESSILFAALFGARLLGDAFGRVRVIAALLLLVGLVLVQLQTI